MAGTIRGSVITLASAGDGTGQVFKGKIKVSSIKLVAGATPGATNITADGLNIYNTTPAADTVVEIGPIAAPTWYGAIIASTLGTNVNIYVHIV